MDDQSPSKVNPGNDNLLSELEGLGPVDMSKSVSASGADEYVQPSQHDMRRSKIVNADMVKKLSTGEESKDERRRSSKGQASAASVNIAVPR